MLILKKKLVQKSKWSRPFSQNFVLEPLFFGTTELVPKFQFGKGKGTGGNSVLISWVETLDFFSIIRPWKAFVTEW